MGATVIGEEERSLDAKEFSRRAYAGEGALHSTFLWPPVGSFPLLCPPRLLSVASKKDTDNPHITLMEILQHRPITVRPKRCLQFHVEPTLPSVGI